MVARQNRPKALASKYKRTHQALVCCVHEIDIMQWYVQSKVTRVRAYEARLDHTAGPDLTWGILEFEGGTLGFVQTMWLLPDKANVQDDGMQVVGTSGVASRSFGTQPVAGRRSGNTGGQLRTSSAEHSIRRVARGA